MTCIDNLRQLGQAFQLWGFEHQDSVPWNLSVAQGGTRPIAGTKSGNPYREFSVLSNELISPKILLCPNDERRNAHAADNWSTSPAGGFLNLSYANNATSYSIGLHANFAAPQSLLSLDRFLRVDVTGTGCSAGVNNAAAVRQSPSSAAWTNQTHGSIGNFLFVDGRVTEVPYSQLEQAFFGWLPPSDAGGGSAHLLIP
jgi:prepilin-type processing-associated H-X9-DG protein